MPSTKRALPSSSTPQSTSPSQTAASLPQPDSNPLKKKRSRGKNAYSGQKAVKELAKEKVREQAEANRDHTNPQRWMNLEPQFKKVVNEGGRGHNWIQELDCVQLRERFPKSDEQQWAKCNTCKDEESKGCEMKGARRVGEKGKSGLWDRQIPIPTPTELHQPSSLTPQQMEDITYVTSFARSLLGDVRKKGDTSIFDQAPTPEAVQPDMVYRCDQCYIDAFPVAVRCGSCSLVWCKECFASRKRTCSSSTPGRPQTPHVLVPITMIHFELAKSLLALLASVESNASIPNPAPSSRTSSPPVPTASLPRFTLADLPPLTDKIRQRLQPLLSLTDSASLVPVHDANDDSVSVMLRTAIADGTPAAVKLDLKGKWNIDGEIWAEMSELSGTWTETVMIEVKGKRGKGGKMKFKAETIKRSGKIKVFLQALKDEKDVRLTDFPADAWFSKAAPKAFAAFEDALPLGEFLREDGKFNLASSLYWIVDRTDLGPKGYLSSDQRDTWKHFSPLFNVYAHLSLR
ncbi:hypothetical protein JCM5353_004856 [Sporobolomyces roseus]